MQIQTLNSMADGKNRQDGAIFGEYLFRFEASGKCNVYKMNELLNSSSANVSPATSFVLDKADIIKPHSNSVAFGNEYFEKGDEFPLLYCNIYNNYAAFENPLCGVTCVYRLVKDGECFKTTLVQLIEIGFTNDPVWRSENIKDFRPFGNFAIGSIPSFHLGVFDFDYFFTLWVDVSPFITFAHFGSTINKSRGFGIVVVDDFFPIGIYISPLPFLVLVGY